MTIYDRRELCENAAATLSQTPSHRRTAFLWAGVSAAAMLLTNLIVLFLNNRINGISGLAGMDTKNALTTLKVALNFFVTLSLPLWNLGHTASALEISRTRQARPGTLLEGFRRFGPFLRFLVLQGVLYIVLLLVSSHISSFLMAMTPLSAKLMDSMLPILENAGTAGDAALDQATLDTLVHAMLPIMACFFLVFLALCIPASYHLRMAPFLLLENPQCGALYAMITSFKMMRHNCLALFLLDLRFWWFYLAEALIIALGFGDVLLPLLGVTLPLDAQVSYYLFYGLALVAQVALYTLCKNRVQVTYARAYDTLSPKHG